MLPTRGHIITGNLKIVSVSRILSVISKGPEYRIHCLIDIKACQEAIAGALNDYCTRWWKREQVESIALNNWQLKTFQIMDKHILFYSNNLGLLHPKPKLKHGSQEFHH